jgi:hypothetical protein
MQLFLPSHSMSSQSVHTTFKLMLRYNRRSVG